MKSLYPGRFQPFHDGHKAMVQRLLDEGLDVIIGLRDTEWSKENPYSLFDRKQMVKDSFAAEFREGRVEVYAIPDFDELVYGRKVGYKIRELKLTEAIEGISATGIRDGNPQIIWLTGNSGSGKSTLAEHLQTFIGGVVLDGDQMRATINQDLGFSMDDRMENCLRVARLAGTMAAQGEQVIVSVIAPSQEIRDAIYELIQPRWVYCRREQIDRADYPYEPPTDSDIIVADWDKMEPEEAAEYVVTEIFK